MKTKKSHDKHNALLTEIEKLAPSLVVVTYWELDEEYKWEPALTAQGLEEEDFCAWEVEVRITGIAEGRFHTGSGWLSGCLLEWGVSPSTGDPEVGGYFPQLLREALEDLLQWHARLPLDTREQMAALLNYVNKYMHEEWEAQQKQRPSV
jgi:hypothetical protein